MLLCYKEGKGKSGRRKRKEGEKRGKDKEEGKQIKGKLSRLACPSASACAYCAKEYGISHAKCGYFQYLNLR